MILLSLSYLSSVFVVSVSYVVRKSFTIFGFLSVTSLGFTWVLGLGFGQTLYFLFYVVFVDCILCGIIAASILWFLANKYMRADSLAKDVEWGYAFDVHLNAFYPPLIIIHFIQLIFYNAVISQDWFISRLLGNTLWLLAIGYYVYITFLGYNCTF